MEPRIGNDLWLALTTGTTLKIRLVLSLYSLMYGFQIVLGLVGAPLPLVDKWAIFNTLSPPIWAAALVGGGTLMLWRVLSSHSLPWLGWVSNVFAFLTWFMIVLSYVVADGWRGLVGTYVVALLMATFCVLRTEATNRDRETA